MTDRKLLKQCLAHFEHLWDIGIDAHYRVNLMPEIHALREQLAKPEQEFKYTPYGLRSDENGKLSIGEISQREWVSLTSEELASIVVEHAGCPTRQLTAIEDKLKEKNNG